jgi:hypothetical protein
MWKSLLQAAGDSGIRSSHCLRDEQDWPHRDRNQRTLSDRRRTSRNGMALWMSIITKKVEAGETQ